MSTPGDVEPHPDAVRSAIALGLDVTIDEICVLQRDHLDGPLVERLRSDPTAAAADEDLSPELRRHFARSADRRLAVAAGCHEAAPADTVRSVLSRNDVQVLITSAPEWIPTHSELTIAIHGGTNLTLAVARRTDQLDVVRRLISSEHRHVRVALAANRQVPAHELAPLAIDDDASVRAAVARRPGLDATTLHRLADDESGAVRAGIASHAGLDAELLERLSRDPDWICRRAVANNATATTGILGTLGADTDDRVRAAAAGNRNASLRLLQTLCDDEGSAVRRAAARNPAAAGDPAFFDRLEGTIEDYVIVANPSAPTAVLARIAERTALLSEPDIEPDRNDRTILLHLARHPNLDGALLERLVTWSCTDGDDVDRSRLRRDVAERLAGHEALTPDLLERLAEHRDRRVQRKIVDRRNRDRRGADRSVSDDVRGLNRMVR